MNPEHLTVVAWAVWWLSWVAAAVLWRTRAVKRAGRERELVFRLLLAVGVLLLFRSYSRPRGALVLWHSGRGFAWLCFLATVLGFLITWWARIHLGRLWSGAVTRKANHRVVDTGPYRFVRHPIYSGLSLAAIAVGAMGGTLIGLAGSAAMVLGFYMKARLEEDFLREELGDAYEQYRRRVGMLLPFV